MRDAVRLHVHEAQPRESVHAGDRAHHVGEGGRVRVAARTARGQVAAVRGDVLADEHDLARAGRRPGAAPPRRSRRAGGCGTGRGSQGSCSTSSGGGSRRRPAGTPRGRSRCVAGTRARRPRRSAPCGHAREALEHVEQRVLLGDGHERVDLGHRFGEIGAVARRHAARDHELATLASGQPRLRDVEDGLDRLLGGVLDERARVHDDDVGGVGIVGDAVRRGESPRPSCGRCRPRSSGSRA